MWKNHQSRDSELQCSLLRPFLLGMWWRRNPWQTHRFWEASALLQFLQILQIILATYLPLFREVISIQIFWQYLEHNLISWYFWKTIYLIGTKRTTQLTSRCMTLSSKLYLQKFSLNFCRVKLGDRSSGIFFFAVIYKPIPKAFFCTFIFYDMVGTNWPNLCKKITKFNVRHGSWKLIHNEIGFWYSHGSLSAATFKLKLNIRIYLCSSNWNKQRSLSRILQFTDVIAIHYYRT